MTKGVKSKEFGCFWKSMMLVSLCYPEKIDRKNKKHLKKMQSIKTYIETLQDVLPCKYCRCFMKKILIKKYPIDYSGRINLMHSIYVWKDLVTKKLQNQGHIVKNSPPFKVILKKYEKYYAKCDAKTSSCV
jgi:hypothetical protein